MVINSQQRKYALKKVEDLYRAKSRNIEKRHTTPGVDLSPEDRARLLRQGKVTIKKGVTEIQSYTGVVDAFDFSKHEKEKTWDQKKIDKEMGKLKKEYQALKDELVLGDAEKALALLKKFEFNTNNN